MFVITLIRRLFDFLFLNHWKAIDEQARQERAQHQGFDWMPFILLFSAALLLTLQEYFGTHAEFGRLQRYLQTHWEFLSWLRIHPTDPSYRLWSFAWWTGWRVATYLVIPMLLLKVLGHRLRDYYIGFKNFGRHFPIYVVLFILVLPMVYGASRSPSFYHAYPFYKLANRSALDFWAWEVMYSLQFLSLEFFFRGFILQGLRRCMGSAAIFVMAVPYCMIHFHGKPFPETIGAIFAGVILGTLAMRTRSIWGGVFIHVGVAVTMDALALQHCPSAESGLPCQGR